MVNITHHSHVIYDILKKRPHKVGCEIGVHTGQTTLFLLENLPGIKKYFAIDSWESYEKYDGSIYRKPGNKKAKTWNKVMIMFKRLTSLYSHKVIPMRMQSLKAVEQFEDETLDWIFIDANHDYEYIKENLELWTPKVKKGGLIFGHDYKNLKGKRKGWGITRAVNEFVPKDKLHIEKYTLWWFEKQGEKMDIINKQIKKLAPWYQRVDLNGFMTLRKGNKYFYAKAGEHTWNVINQFLPPSLKNMRILDLGCNAGLYSVKSSLLGAKEVIGVDMSPIFFKQALYVKDFFEKFHNKKMNINYIQSDIGNLDLNKYGKFDYVFAISILYHIGKHKHGKYTPAALKEQIEVITKLAKHTKKFIVRCRNGKFNNREYYSKIFKKAGFVESKYIPEGKRGMILYETRS